MKDRESLFDLLLAKVEKMVNGSTDREEKLKGICLLLRAEVSHYDWVGFYLIDESKKELLLGPFAGEPPRHIQIPLGQGVCGIAAERQQILLVPDVSQAISYLSCSPKVRSEIVIPIFKKGRMMAELDIDSHTLGAFTEEDRAFLEKICQLVSRLF